MTDSPCRFRCWLRRDKPKPPKGPWADDRCTQEGVEGGRRWYVSQETAQ
jgi:hypothetical protein